MIRVYYILFFVFIIADSIAQEITVQGKAIDALGGKGINAKISYKSYPTGGISGTINDSTFSFEIFGSSKYSVTAEANGFISNTILVDPKDATVDQKIVRNISLMPTGHTVRLSRLIFNQGKARINPQSFAELDEVVAMMKINTKIEIQLEGHTDHQGNEKANLKLSQDRVDAVKKYLVSKKISKKRIKTKAFGGTQPLSNEKTEEARSLNRRVELRVLKN
ncbi:MAG: OmpA family protein [Bacteroidia bacterium]|nr:OmpA family protein [Bacteroidia bacterium]